VYDRRGGKVWAVSASFYLPTNVRQPVTLEVTAH